MRTLLLLPALILLASSPAMADNPSVPLPVQEQLFASNEAPVVPQAFIGYESPTNSNAPIIIPNTLAQSQPVQPGSGITSVQNNLRWLNL